MPLIRRLEGLTVRGLELAAGHRLDEAAYLVTGGFLTASIYLGGYAAEMLIGAALLRAEGFEAAVAVPEATYRTLINKARKERPAERAGPRRDASHRTPSTGSHSSSSRRTAGRPIAATPGPSPAASSMKRPGSARTGARGSIGSSAVSFLRVIGGVRLAWWRGLLVDRPIVERIMTATGSIL